MEQKNKLKLYIISLSYYNVWEQKKKKKKPKNVE